MYMRAKSFLHLFWANAYSFVVAAVLLLLLLLLLKKRPFAL